MLGTATGIVNQVEIDGVSTVLGAAATGFMWRLYSAVFSQAAGGSNWKLTSDGVDITGNIVNTANAPVVLPPCDAGWIDGTDGKDLTIVGSDALDGFAKVIKIRTGQSAGGYATS